MSGFILGTAIVLALAGLSMILAPDRMLSRQMMAPLPPDRLSRRTFRIGGGVLIALALILVIQSLSE